MSESKMKFLYRFLFIFLSCCFISLPAYLYLFGKKYQRPVLLKALIQKTPTIDQLSPRFFSDYLGLSPLGQPLILKRLDAVKIQNRLKEFPVFKSIEAEFTPLGELCVSYDLRRPLFELYDYKNCGLDKEGFITPLVPFYSPKKLPQIYLGLKQLSWDEPHNISQALDIVDFFEKNQFQGINLKRIDLSRLNHKLISHREIIVIVSVGNVDHYLRIHPSLIQKALVRYVSIFLEPKLKKTISKSCVFDARISKFATIKNLTFSPGEK